MDTTIDRPAARRLADVWDGAAQGGEEGASPEGSFEPSKPVERSQDVRWPRITAMAAFLSASALVSWVGPEFHGRHEHGAAFRGFLPHAGTLARIDPTGDVPMKFQAATVIAGAAMAAGANAQQATQWRVQDGGNGHWYALTAPVVNWSAARTRAADVGGHLATIASAEENAFAAGVAIGENVAYIGAQQLPGSPEPFGGWTWITGEPWSYQSWHFNMDDAPCGYSSGPGEQQYLWMHTAVRQWDDINDVDFPDCALVPKRGIIEWSADCNGDGIVDYGQCRDGSLPDYDGDNVPDCCEQGVACVVGTYPVEWTIADGGNGHWYGVDRFGEQLSWATADTRAVRAGGTLACISSAAENAFVFGLIEGDGDAWNAKNGPWIGARRDDGQWTWVNGEAWTFQLWCGGTGDVEHRGQFWACFGTTPSSLWNDHFGDTGPVSGPQMSRASVIEWSADCNNDGIVDYGQILRGERPDVNANGVPDGCECLADLNSDGYVQGADLGLMLSSWGAALAGTAADINRDGAVDGNDLGLLLAAWGACGN